MGKCFKQKDIDPSIKETIERLCHLDGEARHQAIVDELLKDPDASGIVDRAVQRCPDWNQRMMAGNMIDWLSARYEFRPEDLGEFSYRFARRKNEDGTWTYYTQP
jgi:hypothetical protein